MTSLGAGAPAIFKSIILPASLPGILTALRISLGTALSVLFFTETFGTELGMGYFIMDAWMRVDYTDMFSGIFVLSIMGLTLFIMLDVIEHICCRWKRVRR
jgi:NitT/TauT family transport system permease protein